MARQKAEGTRQTDRRNATVVCVFASCLLPFVFARGATAEILVLKNGRTMSVKAYRVSSRLGLIVQGLKNIQVHISLRA